MLLAEVRNCGTRESLEAILGPPRYAMSGHGYATISADGSQVIRPDFVEVYEIDGCVIELHFKDGRLSASSGWPQPTSWEVVVAVRAQDREL